MPSMVLDVDTPANMPIAAADTVHTSTEHTDVHSGSLSNGAAPTENGTTLEVQYRPSHLPCPIHQLPAASSIHESYEDQVAQLFMGLFEGLPPGADIEEFLNLDYFEALNRAVKAREEWDSFLQSLADDTWYEMMGEVGESMIQLEPQFNELLDNMLADSQDAVASKDRDLGTSLETDILPAPSEPRPVAPCLFCEERAAFQRLFRNKLGF